MSVLVSLVMALASAPADAQAATKYSCAQSLSFRSTPGGTIKGYLGLNWTIDVSTTSGSWSYGFAGYYDPVTGGTGAGNGWVLTSYLSSTPC